MVTSNIRVGKDVISVTFIGMIIGAGVFFWCLGFALFGIDSELFEIEKASSEQQFCRKNSIQDKNRLEQSY